eukprot:CAMPEP_0115707900 /NCGR_PEP_ID=MMETSP0272-20121206/71612_1 /TAXON_ID=71861 /ORGANISM="Scrippsiella trochoidea, Strain CCMP3099" /LENGTH=123 /DNA_ID=CAMNT_0003149329 /DNA_START=326 /DNA_END=692 /DNA_ORIENTATION=-
MGRGRLPPSLLRLAWSEPRGRFPLIERACVLQRGSCSGRLFFREGGFPPIQVGPILRDMLGQVWRAASGLAAGRGRAPSSAISPSRGLNTIDSVETLSHMAWSTVFTQPSSGKVGTDLKLHGG